MNFSSADEEGIGELPFLQFLQAGCIDELGGYGEICGGFHEPAAGYRRNGTGTVNEHGDIQAPVLPCGRGSPARFSPTD